MQQVPYWPCCCSCSHHNQKWPHLVIWFGFYFVPLQRWHGVHNAGQYQHRLQLLVCGTESLLLWQRLPGGWPNYTANSQQQTLAILEWLNTTVAVSSWRYQWQCPLLAPGPSRCICLFKPPQRIISSHHRSPEYHVVTAPTVFLNDQQFLKQSQMIHQSESGDISQARHRPARVLNRTNRSPHRLDNIITEYTRISTANSQYNIWYIAVDYIYPGWLCPAPGLYSDQLPELSQLKGELQVL